MRDEIRKRWSSRLVLAGLLLLAWLFVRSRLYTSWIPTDEGVIGQGADRVLHGELPHRDFVSLWSGGLDAIHALVFRIFGVSLAHLRTLLLYSWFGALAATFAVARRLLSPWMAGALTLAVAEWTLGMWWLPLPSWYTLFLALAGLAAVVRFLEARRAGWLVLAGVTAGAACAIKITGLYAIAALLIFFVWLVQEDTSADAVPRGVKRPYAWLVTVGLCGYLVLVGRLVAGMASWNAVLHFGVPSLALVGLLVSREWTRPSDPDLQRFRRLAALAVPFAAGALAVLATWLAPYVLTGSVGALAAGLFVTPQLRFSVAAYPLPGLRSAGLAALPFILLLAGAPFVRRPLSRMDRWALLLATLGLATVSTAGSPAVLIVWYAFRLLAPACTVIGVWWLAARDNRIAITPGRRSLAFLLVAAAATGSLIQVPFALYTYFLYFVPLLLLALAALVTSQSGMPREVPAALLAFLLWFGYRQPDSLRRDQPARAADEEVPLALPRAGLRVARSDSALYGALYAAVERHRPGDWIYVWHDAPEVYFLTGKRNPTRTLFEAFDDPASHEPSRMRDALVSHHVRVVVLAAPDSATVPISPEFRHWIEQTYPHREAVQRFEVRWRDDTAMAARHPR